MLSPLGIFHTDARGKCVFVNDRWCEITGLTSDEALGDGWAEALHPEDRSRVFETWEQATRTRSVFKAEYRFIDRRGVVHLVLGQALAIRDGRGKPRGMSARSSIFPIAITSRRR